MCSMYECVSMHICIEFKKLFRLLVVMRLNVHTCMFLYVCRANAFMWLPTIEAVIWINIKAFYTNIFYLLTSQPIIQNIEWRKKNMIVEPSQRHLWYEFAYMWRWLLYINSRWFRINAFHFLWVPSMNWLERDFFTIYYYSF